MIITGLLIAIVLILIVLLFSKYSKSKGLLERTAEDDSHTELLTSILITVMNERGFGVVREPVKDMLYILGLPHKKKADYYNDYMKSVNVIATRLERFRNGYDSQDDIVYIIEQCNEFTYKYKHLLK